MPTTTPRLTPRIRSAALSRARELDRMEANRDNGAGRYTQVLDELRGLLQVGWPPGATYLLPSGEVGSLGDAEVEWRNASRRVQS